MENIVNENEKLELDFLRKEVGTLQKAKNEVSRPIWFINDFIIRKMMKKVRMMLAQRTSLMNQKKTM